MIWCVIITTALAVYGIAAYAAWEITTQIHAIAAVWSP
jgi:hypothetical protein